MSLYVVVIVVALIIALFAFPPRKRTHVERLLTELDRSEDEEELAQAEDEVRGLDAMATPEDAAEQLPDWGPGAPRKKK
jgi:hypothetical protein